MQMVFATKVETRFMVLGVKVAKGFRRLCAVHALWGDLTLKLSGGEAVRLERNVRHYAPQIHNCPPPCATTWKPDGPKIFQLS